MKFTTVIIFLLMFSACTPGAVLQTAPAPSATSQERSKAEVSPSPILPTASYPTRTVEDSMPEPTKDQPTQAQETASTSIAASPAAVTEVQIEAVDGQQISGTFYPGSGSPPFPGILLTHMLGGSREQWDMLVPSLTDIGYAVLAVDMRGHGETGGEVDWERARSDTLDAWLYLSSRDDIDSGKTALIGASIGANLSLAAAASEPGINTVVLLSPGLDYRGVTTMDTLEGYGERPVFIAASTEDSYAAESSQALAETAPGEVQLHMFQGAGHGTNMLAREPQLIELILDWLEEYNQ